MVQKKKTAIYEGGREKKFLQKNYSVQREHGQSSYPKKKKRGKKGSSGKKTKESAQPGPKSLKIITKKICTGGNPGKGWREAYARKTGEEGKIDKPFFGAGDREITRKREKKVPANNLLSRRETK